MYTGALKAAEEAARLAGEHLLREFYRPGGPRGTGGHAEADGEAEALIAAHLQPRFPDWGFRSEERRGLWKTGGDHVWVVDPNDGTMAYLEGWRGSAVSIALVHQGRPVLGVVHAYAVGQGDLISWAEGCGPVRRNGVPCKAPVGRSELAAHDVVLVSQHADRHPAVNARACAPARFRAVPGIAWRLALVAAGEAAAAVSLSGPCDWDYAGGHALLRGGGGELVDQSGRPVTYGPDGRSAVEKCFGGSLPAVRQLVTRDWKLGTRWADALCWPSARRILAEPGILERAQGCLLGQVAGDSLGSLVEFQDPSAIRRCYPHGLRTLADGGTWDTLAGQPTDDSELALALSRSILAAGRYSAGAAALAYGTWCRSNPFDVGRTTSQTLGRIPSEATEEEARAACSAAARRVAEGGGQANGSLMRISPLGVFGHALPAQELADLARQDSSLTHAHPVCQDACAAYSIAVGHAVRTGAGAEEVWRVACDWARRHGHPDVLTTLEAASQAPPADYTSKQGWVRLALQNAFYRLLHCASLEEGVVQTVACGGDTDTNGAIAGALLGAVHGRSGVPADWEAMVLTCRPLPPAPRPRPQEYWPVDLLVQAEQLAALGHQAART